jgi:hypothetical protein
MMIFSLVLTDEDNDGAPRSLNQQQINNIQSMIDACELDQVAVSNLLRYAQANSLEEIGSHRYADVMAMLNKKLAKLREGAK